MSGNYVVIASGSLIYLWQFKSPRTLFGIGSAVKRRSNLREGIQRYALLTKVTSLSSRMCHIDHKDGSLSSKVGGGNEYFTIDTTTTSQSFATANTTASQQLQQQQSDAFAPLLSAGASDNPIVAMTARDGRSLYVARSNGDVLRYRLPELWPEAAIHATDKRPVRIEVNCDGT